MATKTKNNKHSPGLLLALDCSLTATGYAVIDFEEASRGIGKAINAGSIITPKGLLPDLCRKFELKAIRQQINEYRPEVIVMEDIKGVQYKKLQGNSDFNTVYSTIELIGGVKLLAESYTIYYRSIDPKQWKTYCQIPMGGKTDYNEQKRLSLAIAKEFFGPMLIDHNAADALNIARCYAQKFATAELRQLRIL